MPRIDVTKTELVWPGKYNDDGTSKEVPRVSLPFQVIETVNESRLLPVLSTGDDPAICASHDFCDANMAMYEAFENIMGHPVDPQKKADASVWDKAWNMAKASDFAVGPRANPVRNRRLRR